jgi:hypothetical protein
MRQYGMRRWAATIGLSLSLGGSAAFAAEKTTCFLEHGVLMVPARVAGLTGLFILDPATPRSQLDATQATLAGFGPSGAVVPVAVGALRRPSVRIEVAPLDGRTRTMPTPVTGVLGADVLAGAVLRVRPSPCRFWLDHRPAGVSGAIAVRPLIWRDGIPLTHAAVADGERARKGLFAIATGDGVAVRFNPDAARIAGAAPGSEPITAPLRALSIGEALIENAPAAIGAEPRSGALGDIGNAVWSRYELVLDLVRNRLTLFKP